MAVKPSRSEIESAVAARAKPNKRSRKTKNNSQNNLAASTKTRKQHVLGGNIEGVSDYQNKRTHFRNSTTVNYLNWVAGIIVLMIIIVFFWPQANNQATNEIPAIVNLTNSAAYSMESRVEEIQPATQDNIFTRESDIKRANGFREQDEKELKVRALLISAQSHIEKGELSIPNNNNAVSDFKAVLRIDPRNFKARQGLELINEQFLTSAYTALEVNKPNLAANILQKLKKINKESDATLEFSKALIDWRQNRLITALLLKAEQAQKDDKIILPARDNALYYFQEVLDINDSNELAIDGILGVAAYYIDKTETAIKASHFEAANNYVTTISAIEPEHPSIPILKEKITIAETKLSKKKPNRKINEVKPVTEKSDDNIQVKENRSQATNVFSSNRTPNKEAAEQAAFDRQYLQRGLEAYYQGNYETAAALLQPLADKGVSRAQFRIGYMHYLGRHFKKDSAEADRVIRSAIPAIQKFADEGRAWAQSDLGSLYEDGLVLPKDYDEANYWYRAAAEQGYPGAQTNLGIMYARGRGVSSNRRTAIEWFQRAAKQGDIAAKRNLESLGVKP